MHKKRVIVAVMFILAAVFSIIFSSIVAAAPPAAPVAAAPLAINSFARCIGDTLYYSRDCPSSGCTNNYLSSYSCNNYDGRYDYPSCWMAGTTVACAAGVQPVLTGNNYDYECQASGSGARCVSSRCGDGAANGAETCDWGPSSAPTLFGGNGGAWPSQPLIVTHGNLVSCPNGYPSAAGKYRCPLDCGISTSDYEYDGCGKCGDGAIQGPEECDSGSVSTRERNCPNDPSKKQDCHSQTCKWISCVIPLPVCIDDDLDTFSPNALKCGAGAAKLDCDDDNPSVTNVNGACPVPVPVPVPVAGCNAPPVVTVTPPSRSVAVAELPTSLLFSVSVRNPVPQSCGESSLSFSLSCGGLQCSGGAPLRVGAGAELSGGSVVLSVPANKPIGDYPFTVTATRSDGVSGTSSSGNRVVVSNSPVGGHGDCTAPGACIGGAPLFCNAQRQVVDNCARCGCPFGSSCQANGLCVADSCSGVDTDLSKPCCELFGYVWLKSGERDAAPTDPHAAVPPSSVYAYINDGEVWTAANGDLSGAVFNPVKRTNTASSVSGIAGNPNYFRSTNKRGLRQLVVGDIAYLAWVEVTHIQPSTDWRTIFSSYAVWAASVKLDGTGWSAAQISPIYTGPPLSAVGAFPVTPLDVHSLQIFYNDNEQAGKFSYVWSSTTATLNPGSLVTHQGPWISYATSRSASDGTPFDPSNPQSSFTVVPPVSYASALVQLGSGVRPAVQVVGDKVYYAWSVGRIIRPPNIAVAHSESTLMLASSALDGSGLTTPVAADNVEGSFDPSFKVVGGRIYVAGIVDQNGFGVLYTNILDSGTLLPVANQKLMVPISSAAYGEVSLQAFDGRMYYVFADGFLRLYARNLDGTAVTDPKVLAGVGVTSGQFYVKEGRAAFSNPDVLYAWVDSAGALWTATSEADGSWWLPTKQVSGGVSPGLKADFLGKLNLIWTQGGDGDVWTATLDRYGQQWSPVNRNIRRGGGFAHYVPAVIPDADGVRAYGDRDAKIYYAWIAGNNNEVMAASVNPDGTGWQASRVAGAPSAGFARYQLQIFDSFSVNAGRVYYAWVDYSGSQQVVRASDGSGAPFDLAVAPGSGISPILWFYSYYHGGKIYTIYQTGGSYQVRTSVYDIGAGTPSAGHVSFGTSTVSGATVAVSGLASVKRVGNSLYYKWPETTTIAATFEGAGDTTTSAVRFATSALDLSGFRNLEPAAGNAVFSTPFEASALNLAQRNDRHIMSSSFEAMLVPDASVRDVVGLPAPAPLPAVVYVDSQFHADARLPAFGTEFCLGDDGEPFFARSRQCDAGVCADEPADKAACDKLSDCVFGSVCYSDVKAVAQTYFSSDVSKTLASSWSTETTENVNANAKRELCDPGKWTGGGLAGNVDGNVRNVSTANANGPCPAKGCPVASAVVKVLGTSLSAVTDAAGHYSISSVPVGAYDITASKPSDGYGAASVLGKAVVSGTVVVDFTLQRALGDCEDDCTLAGSASCDASCHGRGGCFFYSDATRTACDGQSGLAQLASGDYVSCCEGQPYPPLKADVSVDAKKVTVTKKPVLYNGKLVNMVFIMYKK